MITIGILIFPQVEELDFVAPFEVLSYSNKITPDSTRVLLIAENSDPIEAFNGMKVIPHTTLATCPPLDIIVVPGGKGRLAAMRNTAITEFIRAQSHHAKFTASVCTGALILAATGLLANKKATTYHTAFDELKTYTVDVLTQKVVQDGRIITSAGVSSGIELGLYLLKLLFGASMAQEVADKIEYSINVAQI